MFKKKCRSYAGLNERFHICVIAEKKFLVRFAFMAKLNFCELWGLFINFLKLHTCLHPINSKH